MEVYHVRVYNVSTGSERETSNNKSSRKTCSTCNEQQVSFLHSERPGNLETLLSLPTLSYSMQLEHCWNPDDCSHNIYVKQDDPFTFHRLPVAKSTDGIRGKVGYSEGIHLWEVSWPRVERGTHAVVGVATLNAAVHCSGYQDLVGCDDESWGWDIARCVALHGSKDHSEVYPKLGASAAGFDLNSNGHDTYDVPYTFHVVLDMDEGTLSFIANGEFLGIAFDNLRGRTLYPIISAVWGHCEVTMKYINGIKPQPMSLMHLSRLAIRKKIREVGGIDSLRLLDDLNYPTALKDYLNYRIA